MSDLVTVGIAEIQVRQGDVRFRCVGIGSCVGVCLFDPIAKVTGFAHVMLPASFADHEPESPGKFADTAIPALIAAMEERGADPTRIVAAIGGGAQMFRILGEGESLDLGPRNLQAVEEQLEKYGIACLAADTGGNLGRSLTFASDTGAVFVKANSKEDRVLCELRAA